MKFSLMEIKNNAFKGPYPFDGIVDVSDISKMNNDIRRIDPVKVNGFCTVDKDEYIFSFHVKGKMVLPCARTLVDVPYPFEFDATEIFTTSPIINTEDEENGVHQVDDEMLDLTPYIKENIILETPYRVFSNEKPLEAGEGWTFRDEEDFKKEQEERIDPRLAKLQQLLDNKEDKRR